MPKLTIDEIARTAHEVNRAYCIAIGDMTQEPWEAVSEDKRRSSITAVEFGLANPDETPRQRHDSWAADKIAAGWKFGPEKDAEAKTHPCLVDYEALPLEQRVKDYLLGSVIQTLGSIE